MKINNNKNKMILNINLNNNLVKILYKIKKMSVFFLNKIITLFLNIIIIIISFKIISNKN